jgi:hypothetical protein
MLNAYCRETLHGANETQDHLSDFVSSHRPDGDRHGHAGTSRMKIKWKKRAAAKGFVRKPNSEIPGARRLRQEKPAPAPNTDVLPGFFPLVLLA